MHWMHWKQALYPRMGTATTVWNRANNQRGDMPDLIETDDLVVGAGAAGMTVTDALLTHGDASVTLIDRRHAPGGHWHDAYPCVRLHQPSAFYGVDSVPLGKRRLSGLGSRGARIAAQPVESLGRLQ